MCGEGQISSEMDENHISNGNESGERLTEILHHFDREVYEAQPHIDCSYV